MNSLAAREGFTQEIQQPEAQISLARAALYLAQEEYPDLAVDAYLTVLDTMAAEIAERLSSERYPLKVIQTLNRYLFQDLGFVGNSKDYYDPRNSYLNHVLDRRMGIPITLSLVYLEVAQRVGFTMTGVGMPGHFLIRPAVEEMQVFVDPFHRGEVLFLEDCRDRLTQIYGQPMELRPEFLQGVSPRQFLARMLTNLKLIYLKQGDLDRTLAAVERILLLFPDALEERRDRGLLYYEQGRWENAIGDLEFYLHQAPMEQNQATIRRILDIMYEHDQPES